MSAPLSLAPPPSIPEILINENITAMADEAIKALAKRDGIYERGGRLVHVVRFPEAPKYRKGERVRRQPGTPTIRTLAFPTLLEALSSAAIWKARRGKGSKAFWAPTYPSSHAARAVFERGEWGGLRTLVGVTTAPTFRADGSILQQPGFDPDTGLLYWPNGTFHRVPEQPSLEDARDAYRYLCETVRLFPFADDSHRAAWVCSVLSLLARPAIDGAVPLFLMNANTRGCGKTKLADAAFRIALGYGAACTSLPETNEEIRKTITSCVLAGDAAVLFDNLKRELGGEAIEGAITSPTWKARRLGSDDQASAPMRIVWFATGNNVSMSSDMASRAIHIRLESPLENPEDRDDTFDLNEWIDDKRHHLVTWALTILRAWHVAGRPQRSRIVGRFEGWSAVIPQAVHWASGVDPLFARASQDEGIDQERHQLAAVVDCIGALSTSSPISVKQLITALYGGGDRHDGTTTPDHHPSYAGAREALEAVTFARGGATPDTRRVGKYLQRSCGRVVGGRRIVRGPVSNGLQTWTVKGV